MFRVISRSRTAGLTTSRVKFTPDLLMSDVQHASPTFCFQHCFFLSQIDGTSGNKALITNSSLALYCCSPFLYTVTTVYCSTDGLRDVERAFN